MRDATHRGIAHSEFCTIFGLKIVPRLLLSPLLSRVLEWELEGEDGWAVGFVVAQIAQVNSHVIPSRAVGAEKVARGDYLGAAAA
jgi:hypothetical protein